VKNNDLIVERAEGFCTLTINRPEKRNTLTPELFFGIRDAFEALSRDKDIRAVIITGAGSEAFCAGYDISAIPTNLPPEEGMTLLTRHVDCLQSIASYEYPVIAMINGYTFGGGFEMAVLCDIRIASDNAVFGMPPAKLGIVYSSRGLRNFIHVLGFSNTKEIFFTGRRFNAQRAKEMGLVNHVVNQEDLKRFTYEMALEIAGNAPLTLSATKRTISKYSDLARLSEQDEAEITGLRVNAFRSLDLKEGQTAFKERRKPRFTGQ
jgi:enoyl-CoA hydratase